MEYKVVSAMKSGEYEGKFGKMVKYLVQLDGQDQAVELSQKPETPAPSAGSPLNGDIEDTQYGRRFKKVNNSNFNGGNGGSSRGSNDSATNASIQKQVALKAAVDITVANLPLGKEQPTGKKQVEGVLAMAGAFDAWLKNGESPKVFKEGEKAVEAAKTILAAKPVDNEPNFMDDEIPTDIDLDKVDFL